jgi:DNA-binding beta-propeller fold protein YncE
MTRFAHAPRLVFPLAAALLAACGGPGGSGQVTGRYIVTVSDADMSAPALITGELDPKPAGAEDSLTVITLPIREPVTPFAQIPVSNSVIGPPNCLAVTRDGRHAYVVETRGPAPEGARSVRQLPRGKRVFAINMDDPLKPFVQDAVEVGSDEADTEPLSIDVNEAGDMLVIARRAVGEQIVFIPVRDGRFGEALGVSLQGLDNSATPPSAVLWRPGGRHFAVTLPEVDQVIFYEFVRGEGDGGGEVGIRSWGPPVHVGKYPVSGAFTPDGRYFVTTEAQWGKDVEGFNVGAPEGSVSVIRLSDEPMEQYDEAGRLVRPVEHRVVATAVVGVSPQGIAVSPDGRMVVTANLRRSFLPEADPRLTKGGSLSLLSLDAPTGRLGYAGEFMIDAMPVGLCFDARGEHVVVTLFRSFDPASSPDYGELGFWRVRPGSPPALENANLYVSVGKGPHGVVIVR